jgi:hypothetical protein
MPARYDVFRMQDGNPVWLAAAESLHDAKKQVDEADCECLAFDQMTGEKTVVMPGQDVPLP